MSVTLVVRARLKQTNPWIRGQFIADDPWATQSIEALLRQVYAESTRLTGTVAPADWLRDRMLKLTTAPRNPGAISLCTLPGGHRVIMVRSDIYGSHTNRSDADIIKMVTRHCTSGRLVA